MGDMADYTLECIEDDLYFSNLMYEEETNTYLPPVSRKTLRCKFCDQSPLLWNTVNGRWILVELNGDVHDCPNHPLPLEVLKSLTKKKRMNNNLPQLVPIPSWDEFFMRHVYLAASKSKDPRTKIGAILVRGDIIISEGYNGFSRGVRDLPERYLDRETKYKYVVHGEVNSILNAARHGIKTDGSILYTNGIPCENCGKTIIQAGVLDVIVHKQWPEIPSSIWAASAEITKTMFQEAGVLIREFDCVLGLKGVCDGKIINV